MDHSKSSSSIDYDEFNLFDAIDEDDTFLAPFTSANDEAVDSWGLGDEDFLTHDERLDDSTQNHPQWYDEEESPRTPLPPMLPVDDLLESVAEVTPESKPKLQTPQDVNSVELQLEYLRTLKKLTKSMRRSDETRSIVKRQRLSDSDGSSNFFQTSRWSELELSRQKIAKLIHHESTKRNVF
jgi:hypothetical protein